MMEPKKYRASISPRFEALPKSELYPLMGLYYCCWEGTDRDFESAVRRSAIRVLPTTRIGNDIIASFQRIEEISSKLEVVGVFVIDLTKDYYPSDPLNIPLSEAKKLIPWFTFNYEALISAWSNITVLPTLIQDCRRLTPKESQVVSHLESFEVDRHSAFSRLSSNQFLEKVSALNLRGELEYSKDRNYNSFTLNPTGTFNF